MGGTVSTTANSIVINYMDGWISLVLFHSNHLLLGSTYLLPLFTPVNFIIHSCESAIIIIIHSCESAIILFAAKTASP
jgi:hypothetical protein